MACLGCTGGRLDTLVLYPSGRRLTVHFTLIGSGSVDHNRRMVSRWLAFVIWAAVAFTAAAWLLKLSASGRPVPAHALAVDTTASARGDLTRLLGATPVVSEAAVTAVRADARYKLIGVVAAPSPVAVAKSVAVIAVDGKPPRAYRVGAPVDGETVLLAVRARSVDLGPRGGPLSSTLELAPVAVAATGSLPPPSSLAGQGPMPGSVPGQPPDPAGNPPAESPPQQMLAPQPLPQPQAQPGQPPNPPGG